jgi:hypothetical protein
MSRLLLSNHHCSGFGSLGFELNWSCTANENRDCVPLIHVTSQVVHSMQAILVLIAGLAITLAFTTRRWSTGVFSDPRNILGVAVLIQSSYLRTLFSQLNSKSPTKDIVRQLGDIKFSLRSDISDPDHPKYGIIPSTQPNPSMHTTEPKIRRKPISVQQVSGKTDITRVGILLGTFAAFLSALIAVSVYYIVTDENTGFERFMSGQRFGPRFLFTVCGILINFAWVSVLNGNVQYP